MQEPQFITALEKDIARFNFFQLLRLLEDVNAGKTCIGYADKPADDWLRLGQEPSMAFSPSSLAKAFFDQQKGILNIKQYFFGLFGPNGPLPLHLTEYARERIRNYDDESFAQFADIFHHRLLTFFYRTWSDTKPKVKQGQVAEDAFSRKLSSFFGKQAQFAQCQDNAEKLAQCFYAGRYSQQTTNAEGLIAVVGNFFKVPVEIKQFVGGWVELPAEECFRLSDAIDYGNLGQESTLGGRVWDCQSKFSLVLGPLSIEEYRQFMPGTPNLNTLNKMVKNYLGNALDWDVQLILREEEASPISLGHYGDLGRTSWMYHKQLGKDFDEYFVSPQRELTW